MAAFTGNAKWWTCRGRPIKKSRQEWLDDHKRRKHKAQTTERDVLQMDLLNEIHKFKENNTYHLERALRLYVKVMDAKTWESLQSGLPDRKPENSLLI